MADFSAGTAVGTSTAYDLQDAMLSAELGEGFGYAHDATGLSTDLFLLAEVAVAFGDGSAPEAQSNAVLPDAECATGTGAASDALGGSVWTLGCAEGTGTANDAEGVPYPITYIGASETYLFTGSLDIDYPTDWQIGDLLIAQAIAPAVSAVGASLVSMNDGWHEIVPAYSGDAFSSLPVIGVWWHFVTADDSGTATFGGMSDSDAIGAMACFRNVNPLPFDSIAWRSDTGGHAASYGSGIYNRRLLPVLTPHSILVGGAAVASASEYDMYVLQAPSSQNWTVLVNPHAGDADPITPNGGSYLASAGTHVMAYDPVLQPAGLAPFAHGFNSNSAAAPWWGWWAVLCPSGRIQDTYENYLANTSAQTTADDTVLDAMLEAEFIPDTAALMRAVQALIRRSEG